MTPTRESRALFLDQLGQTANNIRGYGADLRAQQEQDEYRQWQEEMTRQQQGFQQGLIEQDWARQDEQSRLAAEREAGVYSGLYAPQQVPTGQMQPVDPNMQGLGYSPRPTEYGGTTDYQPVMESGGGVYGEVTPETQAQIDIVMAEQDPYIKAGMWQTIQPQIIAEQAEARAAKIMEPLQFLADNFRDQSGFSGPLTAEQMTVASQMRPDLFDPDYAFNTLQSRAEQRMWEKQTAWSFSQQGSSDEDIATFFGEGYTPQDIRQFVDGWQLEVDRLIAEQGGGRGGGGGASGGEQPAPEGQQTILDWYATQDETVRSTFDSAYSTAPDWMSDVEAMQWAYSQAMQTPEGPWRPERLPSADDTPGYTKFNTHID